MAIASIPLIQLLRKTAQRLENSPQYQWGHMGHCNCGHLAQELTGLPPEKIHQAAMLRYGDWTEQSRAYCPDSGLPIDYIVGELRAIGLSGRDIEQLEWLSDDKINRRLPTAQRHPKRNNKADVIAYLNAWATLLEEELALADLLEQSTTPAEAIPLDVV